MIMQHIQMMIVGAQKAGTSSLVRYLGQHPQVCTHRTGEFTFFVNDEEYKSDYEKLFPFYFGDCDPEARFIVAKSAGVMYLPEAIRRLYKHNPDIEIVILLRNPVDRAYSAYCFARQRGWEPLTSFEAALAAGIERFKGNWIQERGCMYLGRGEYVRYLPLLYETFGEEHVHVFLTEDLKDDAENVCHQCFQALGVDPDFTPDVAQRHNEAATVRYERLARLISVSPLKRVFSHLIPHALRYRIKNSLRELNRQEATPQPMNPETRLEMIKHFEPFNAKLSELLGRDLSHWDIP